MREFIRTICHIISVVTTAVMCLIGIFCICVFPWVLAMEFGWGNYVPIICDAMVIVTMIAIWVDA